MRNTLITGREKVHRKWELYSNQSRCINGINIQYLALLVYFGLWTIASYLLLIVYHALVYISKTGLFGIIVKFTYLQNHLHMQHMYYDVIFFLLMYNISQILAYTKGFTHSQRYTYPKLSIHNLTPTIKTLSIARTAYHISFFLCFLKPQTFLDKKV